METLKNRVKSARVNSEMSQQDLADRLGITKQSISQYERGVRTPDVETLVALGDVLNLSIDYLTGRSDVTVRFLNEDDLNRLATRPENISTEDQELLNAYHAAPDHVQTAIKTLLKIE